MKIFIVVVLFALSIINTSLAENSCANLIGGEKVSDRHCEEQLSLQEVYKELSEVSLYTSMHGKTLFKWMLAESISLKLDMPLGDGNDPLIYNYMDDARRTGFNDVLELEIVKAYQRKLSKMSNLQSRNFTRQIINEMFNSTGDEYAGYELHRENKIILVKGEDFESVTPIRIMQDGVAYVQIKLFASGTEKKIKSTISNIINSNQEVKALIMDLRNNPGGGLYTSIDSAEFFLKKDMVVTITKNGGEPLKSYVSKTRDFLDGLPIALLSNHYSGSGSELFMAALKENDRAKIIGKVSYGKGTIQQRYILKNGDLVKFSTGVYLTPKSNVVNGVGIIPDIAVDKSFPACQLSDGGIYDSTICAAYTQLVHELCIATETNKDGVGPVCSSITYLKNR